MTPQHRLAVEIMYYELHLSPHEIASHGFEPRLSMQSVELALGLDDIGRRSPRNRMISFDGKNRTISEWARITGIPHTTIHDRLKKGATVEQALTTPVKRRSDNRKPDQIKEEAA